MNIGLFVLSLIFVLAPGVHGHARLLSPPQRGSLWRFPQFEDLVPPNYDDDGLSAGGIGGTSGGKHGICGDPYTQKAPRPHETGGGVYALFPTLGSKVIAGCFKPGQVLDLAVEITANHKGYFEFGLCKLNGRNDRETEECFQSLYQPNGSKKWQVPPGVKLFNLQYTLPQGVTCEGDSHCVLRSWWVGGNNADVGMNGQEQFWNCADIYISDNCGSVTPSPPAPSTPSPVPSTSTPTLRPTSSSTTTTPSPPDDKCDGQHGCYWPDNKQLIPYGKSDCILFPSFIWCP